VETNIRLEQYKAKFGIRAQRKKREETRRETREAEM